MNKQILILAVLISVAGVGSWFLLDDKKLALPDRAKLFNDVTGYAKDIDTILVKNSTGAVFTAKRMLADNNDHTFPIEASEVKTQFWHIINVVGSDKPFAADQDKLRLLLNALVNAELIEPKTAQESKFERLGLRGIDEPDSQAIDVSIHAGSKAWSVLVGKEASAGKGTYVRKPQEQQTWLSNQNFDIEESQNYWLERTLFNFSADNIRAIQRMDNEQWKIEKLESGEANFQLVDRQDSDLRYDTILDGFASTVSSLAFDQLHVMDGAFWNSLTPSVVLELDTFAGDKFILTVAESEDKMFLKISSDTRGDSWSNWLFEVSTYSKAQLNKGITDFIASPNEVEETTE